MLRLQRRINRITSNILIYNQPTHNKRTAEKITKRSKVEPLYDFAIFARHFHREIRHCDRRVKSRRMYVATTRFYPTQTENCNGVINFKLLFGCVYKIDPWLIDLAI